MAVRETRPGFCIRRGAEMVGSNSDMEDQLDQFAGNPDHTYTFCCGGVRAGDYKVTRSEYRSA